MSRHRFIISADTTKRKMKIAVLLATLCYAHVASGVTHTLQYFYTATTGIPNFPEFITLGVLDGEQLDYYDSSTKALVPKAAWMATSMESDYWSTYTQVSAGSEQAFKSNINIVKERFNQSDGVHTFQFMVGCQWDDESGDKTGYRQYGYDGEDFISFDVKTMQYTAPVPQAVLTKQKWENIQADLQYWKNYLTNECVDWLKKYVQYGRSTLERKVAPEVSLLQKGPGVVCHATGFYPEGVMITWKKDGEEMQDDVDVGETLPNEDGTFQKRAVLTVSPEERKNGQYSCEITHKSGTPIIKILDEDELRRTNSNPGSVPPVVIIGVVVGLLVVIALIGGAVFWKYKKPGKGFVPANTGEGSSHSSNEA